MTSGSDETAAFARSSLDALDQKLLAHFPGKVVRKDLVTPLKGEYQVPNYVLEFLLGRYCSSTDEEVIASGLTRTRSATGVGSHCLCRWAERWRWSEAQAVTAGAVRCSAWLGASFMATKSSA